MTHYLITTLFLSLFISCSYDFGDELPDETLISDPPTWEGGIQALMYQKCDNCHGILDSQFVPGNAKDLNFYFSRDENAFAQFADRIQARVFDAPDSPMPPLYGTPLTEQELQGLREYIKKF